MACCDDYENLVHTLEEGQAVVLKSTTFSWFLLSKVGALLWTDQLNDGLADG